MLHALVSMVYLVPKVVLVSAKYPAPASDFALAFLLLILLLLLLISAEFVPPNFAAPPDQLLPYIDYKLWETWVTILGLV